MKSVKAENIIAINTIELKLQTLVANARHTLELLGLHAQELSYDSS